MFEQPIIERKNTSPLATSLLVVSAVCLLAATIFVGAQIKGLKVDNNTDAVSSADSWAQKTQKRTLREIRALIADAEE